MPKIEYVVFSDMHLGAENSLLTNLVKGGYQTDNSKASPVMIQMVECLRTVLSKCNPEEKPTLVLNGDLMELALTTTNDASMAFLRFIELVMPEDESQRLFKPDILFIPGNHDHNLWETSRYNFYISSLKSIKPHDKIFPLLHITKMFEKPKVTVDLLSSLVQIYPYLRDSKVNVKAAYPAFAHRHKEKDKCVIFSHGHFIESMYSIMTNIDIMLFPDRRPPASLNDLESQNFAWIDFFWSTMGRSGIVGKDVQLLYDKMQDGNEVERIITSFARSISMKKKNKIVAWFEWKVLKELFHLTLAKTAKKERSESGILSDDCFEGLKKYLEIYIRNQLVYELDDDIPDDLTFIFGHTHKPFQQYVDFLGYTGKVRVFNSGGWVVDTTTASTFHGGNIILVDDNLDTVALKMYREDDFTPGFQIITHDLKNEKNDLYKCLVDEISFNQEPWLEFERVATREVLMRHEYLKEIIKSNSL